MGLFAYDCSKLKQPVDDRYLNEAKETQHEPDGCFPKAQASLAHRAERERNRCGTCTDHVARTQSCFSGGLIVHGRDGIRLAANHKSIRRLEMQCKMPVKNTFILQPQPGISGAPHQKRKTAGNHTGARLFTGKNP